MKSVTVYSIFIVTLFLPFFSGPLEGIARQDAGETLVIGTRETIQSKILNEERHVHIFLPEGYSASQAKYPVLFMLYSVPADFHFNTGVAAGLSRMRLVPPMITVAFDLGDGRRDLTPTPSPDYGANSGGAETFLRYVNEELVPLVENKYRTTRERLFWSHSIGGLFGIYSLLKKPELFQSVLVSSPYFVYDRGEQYIIKNTESFLKNRKEHENFLYICVGNEPRLKAEIESFLRILGEIRPEGLTWRFVEMAEENHMSILARSLTEGLRAFSTNSRQRQAQAELP